MGQIGQDTQGAVQDADGHEAGVGNEGSLREGNFQPLLADVPQGTVSLLLVAHDVEPPQISKLLVTHSLDTARGSPCLARCAIRASGPSDACAGEPSDPAPLPSPDVAVLAARSRLPFG